MRGRGLVAERKLWAALTTQEVGTGTPRDLCLLPRLSSAAATPRCVSGGPTLNERLCEKQPASVTHYRRYVSSG